MSKPSMIYPHNLRMIQPKPTGDRLSPNEGSNENHWIGMLKHLISYPYHNLRIPSSPPHQESENQARSKPE